MLLVEVDGLCNSVGEVDRRCPSEFAADQTTVGLERPDVDPLMLLRPRHEAEPASAAGSRDDHRCDLCEREIAPVADVVDPSDGRIRRREQQAGDDIVDVKAVTALGAVTEDLDRLPREGLADEHRQESELIAGQPLAGTVDVAQPQRRCSCVIRLRIDHVQLLAGELGNAVDIHRVRRRGLIDRQTSNAAVHLPGRCVNDPNGRIHPADDLEQVGMIERVQPEVLLWVDHRRGVTDLTGQIEDDVGTGDEFGDTRIANARDQGFDVLAIDVAAIAAVGRDEGVDDLDDGSFAHQAVHEIGPDEAQSAGHDTRRTVEWGGASPSTGVFHGCEATACFVHMGCHTGNMDSDEYRRLADNGENHWWFRSTRSLLRQLIEPLLDTSAGVLYLDAAGGTGATGGWLSSISPTVLVDVDSFALETGTEAFAGYLGVRADINQLPVAPDSFAAVLCVTALYHRLIPEPAATVREFARVTKPGGVVCLLEPGGKRLQRGHDRATHTARRFSVKDLRSMAEAADLEIIRATGAYSFLVPPAALLSLVERGEQTSDVGRNQTGLGGALGALAAAERRFLRRFDLPFGLSAIVIARKRV